MSAVLLAGSRVMVRWLKCTSPSGHCSSASRAQSRWRATRSQSGRLRVEPNVTEPGSGAAAPLCPESCCWPQDESARAAAAHTRSRIMVMSQMLAAAPGGGKSHRRNAAVDLDFGASDEAAFVGEEVERGV